MSETEKKPVKRRFLSGEEIANLLEKMTLLKPVAKKKAETKK